MGFTEGPEVRAVDGDSVAAAGNKGVDVGSTEDGSDVVASDEAGIAGCVVGSSVTGLTEAFIGARVGLLLAGCSEL